jgi:PIN domain nuclease of toxin-antitoxin system
MRRLLLDTHALIWWLQGDDKLGALAIAEIGHEQNEVYVSAASVWEMSIKRQSGKLKVPLDIEYKIEQAGFKKLSISLFHSDQAGKLADHHKDPFDRMLIAQAQAEGLIIVTKDEHFPKYGIQLIDASQ